MLFSFREAELRCFEEVINQKDAESRELRYYQQATGIIRDIRAEFHDYDWEKFHEIAVEENEKELI